MAERIGEGEVSTNHRVYGCGLAFPGPRPVTEAARNMDERASLEGEVAGEWVNLDVSVHHPDYSRADEVANSLDAPPDRYLVSAVYLQGRGCLWISHESGRLTLEASYSDDSDFKVLAGSVLECDLGKVIDRGAEGLHNVESFVPRMESVRMDPKPRPYNKPDTYLFWTSPPSNEGELEPERAISLTDVTDPYSLKYSFDGIKVLDEPP